MNDIYEGLIIEAKQMQFSGCDCRIDFDEMLPALDAYQEHLNQERWFEEILEVIGEE